MDTQRKQVSAASPAKDSSGVTFTEGPKHEVLYASGGASYCERLAGGHWIGQWLGAAGKAKSRDEEKRADARTTDAFILQVKDAPGAEGMERRLSGGWQWVSAGEVNETSAQTGRHVVVELASTLLPIRVRIHTLLDGTPVFTRWLEIFNDAQQRLALMEFVPWAGILWSQDAPMQLGRSLKQDWPWEGWFGWKPLAPGFSAYNRDYGTGVDHPYFIIHNESRDEYAFAQLAWTANYSMQFNKDDGLFFAFGPTAVNALRTIMPGGSTVETPAVHLGLTGGGFDAAVQAMHEHVRRSVLPKRRPQRAYRSQYLIPEDWEFCVYRGEEFNEQNMIKCIDLAAAIGLETFILDGPTWGSILGNWLVPHPTRFPRGLAPLVEHAHKRGLLFGLYCETEGGREGTRDIKKDAATVGPWSDSEIYREHPDWFRNTHMWSHLPVKQLSPSIPVLNLAIPQAAQYLEEEIEKILTTYKLDIYRHDFNAPWRGQASEINRDGFFECDYWRHYEAFHGIFNRLREKYPDVVFQQASAGGFRSDLATAAVFHEHFASDRAAYPFVYQMIAGMSVFLPPEIIVNSTGLAKPADRPDLLTTLREIYTLGTTPMVFNAILPRSVEELDDNVRRKYLRYAELYKTFIRPLLGSSKVFHHSPVNATGGVESGEWFAMEFMAPDQSQGWATIVRLKREAGAYSFKSKGVDPRLNYEVTFDNSGTTKLVSGKELAERGLSISTSPDCLSELVLLKGGAPS